MRRSERIGRGTSFICVMLTLAATLGMSVRELPGLRAGGLSNPDSYMRLARLRDMLDSGTVVFAAARDGSGHGTMLHWSHLLDSLLCLLALPFGLVMEPHGALHAAALIFGPLNVAALGFAVIWAAAPFAARKWLFLGAILPALSPAIVSYGIVGVVHHHVAAAVAAVACWGWAARLIAGHAPARAGLAIGAWIGFGVWLTPETVPVTMMAFGALGLAWIAYPGREDIARAIALCGVSFALVTGLALLADPPAAGVWAVEIDRISLLFAGLALAVAATGISLWMLHNVVRTHGPRLAAAGAAGLCFAAVWAVTFRGVLFGGGMLLDGDLRNAMFAHISEMQPVTGVLPSLQYLLTGGCATVIVIVLAASRRSLLLAYAAVCLAGLLAAGFAHVRFALYPEAAGAIALPAALTLAETATAAWHQIGQSFTRLATVLLFIQVPFLGELPALAATASAAPAGSFPTCDLAGAVRLLTPHPGAVVLAGVNATPELLYKTNVLTVGSLYHRDIAGFLRLRAAWRTPPSETVPPEIDAAEVSLVLGCRSLARSSLVADVRTETLLDQVRTGHPPPWLRRADADPASGYVLYDIVRPEAADPGREAVR